MGSKALQIRNLRKLFWILKKGGKCCKCGYNDLTNLGAFHFHHINPKDKKINIGHALNSNQDIIQEEISKCEILCALCHAKKHNNVTDLVSDALSMGVDNYARINRIPLLKDDFYPRVSKKKDCFCPICNTKISPRSKKFCSKKCYGIWIRKDQAFWQNDITKEKLEDLLTKHSLLAIGKMFGVSDNAVRKWCRSFKMPVKLTDRKKMKNKNVD